MKNVNINVIVLKKSGGERVMRDAFEIRKKLDDDKGN